MDFNAVYTLKFNDEQYMWRYELHPPDLINVAILPCESQNIKNVTLQRDISKENCIRCIISSSEWTRVIMCLTVTYSGCYTAKHVRNEDLWHRRPAKMLDANLFWLWPKHYPCWRDHLRSCVHAGSGHFERMIHQNILWNCQCNLMHETAIL